MIMGVEVLWAWGRSWATWMKQLKNDLLTQSLRTMSVVIPAIRSLKILHLPSLK